MQNSTATKRNSRPQASRRLAVAVAIATVAFAASVAAPTVSSAHAAPVAGFCEDWGCGGNHNEVMATTAAL
ncbi:MAG: hypothetical protein AABM43_14190 [Actinomycetota bacterium]